MNKDRTYFVLVRATSLKSDLQQLRSDDQGLVLPINGKRSFNPPLAA
jgi:hypothetical protein